MKRIYESALDEHIKSLRQMAFLTGPRQVGKTTTCRALSVEGRYVNWDKQSDRAAILKGPDEVATAVLNAPDAPNPRPMTTKAASPSASTSTSAAGP